MKRAKQILTWALMALMVTPGCVPSLNPIYRDEDLVFDSAMLGVWVQNESDAKWELSKRDDKSYRLIYTNEVGQKSSFTARVAQIKGTRFLDLYPEDITPDADGFYRMHLVPIHTIYLVCSTEKSLELAAIDFEWLQKYLAEHPGALQSAVFNDSRLITASTEDLQAFLMKHKDKFKNKIVLVRSVQAVN